jgi:hypothetical protein
MLSSVIGILPIQIEKESMMKQLCFGFMKEINAEVDIEISSEIEKKLIEQMAVLIIQVNKVGKAKNDDLTDK